MATNAVLRRARSATLHRLSEQPDEWLTTMSPSRGAQRILGRAMAETRRAPVAGSTAGGHPQAIELEAI